MQVCKLTPRATQGLDLFGLGARTFLELRREIFFMRQLMLSTSEHDLQILIACGYDFSTV